MPGATHDYGFDTPDGRGGGSSPPPAPSGGNPSTLDTWLRQFQKALPGVQKQLLGYANDYGDIARGVNDPQFAAYRDAQLGLLGQQQEGAVNAVRGQLARTGVTGSAAINQMLRTAQPFDLQQQQVSGQLGLQELGRQDQAREGAMGTLGSYLQNYLAMPSIQVANKAAENAGQSSGGGGGGLCCFIVLEATDGILPDVIRRYRDEQCTPRKRRGYYRAAEVLVPAMRRSRMAKQAIRIGLVKPLVLYGKWFYGESRWGWIASPAKWFWLGLFSILGYGKFIRANGEEV